MKAARTTTTLDFHCPKTREDMAIIDGQEFCSSCNRTLVDFTFMNDEELKEALAKLAGSKSCGTFRPEQVTLSHRQKFVHRLRQVASLTIALFSIKAASAKAGNDVVPATQHESEQSNSSHLVSTSTPGNFKGRLMDNKSMTGIAYQHVLLVNAEGQVLQETNTNPDGLFQFDLTTMKDSADLRVVTTLDAYKNISAPIKVGTTSFTYFLLSHDENAVLTSDLELYLLKRVAYKEKKMFFPRMHAYRYNRMRGAF